MKKIYSCLVLVFLLFSVRVSAQTYSWSASLGSTGFDEITDVATDGSGNTYVVGTYTGTMAMPVAPISAPGSGVQDFVFAKYNSTGVMQYYKRVGTSGIERGYSILIGAPGEVYIAGTIGGNFFFNVVGGGNLKATTGGTDAFIAKYSEATSTYTWVRGIGSTTDDQPSNLQFDNSGNICLSYFFAGGAPTIYGMSNTPPLYASLTSNGGIDIGFATFSTAGTLVSNITMGSTGSDKPTATHIDASGNLYLAGVFGGTVDFDPGVGVSNLTESAPQGAGDAFLAKYNAAGVIQWVGNMKGATAEFINGIGTDVSGNLFITGSFNGFENFDLFAGSQFLTSTGLNDIFIAKYNGSDGSFQQVNKLGGANDDIAKDIKVLSTGDFYLTGSFSDVSVDFDPGAPTVLLSSAGSIDAFYARYTSSFSNTWAFSLGGGSNDQGNALGVASDGKVLLAGYFNGAGVDANPGIGTANLTAVGVEDIFVASYTECVGAAITAQPTASQSICTGQNATFTVTVTGTNLTYLWKKGGVALSDGGSIAGSATATLTITGLVSGDAATYTVDVIGCTGTVVSSNAVLIVPSGALITGQPVATQTLCVGTAASMTVTATGSSLTYQWQKGGVNVTNGGTVSGAITATLTISSLIAGDAGNYTVDVTASGCGSPITSSISVLNVNTAAAITAQPITTQTLCAGSAASFSVTATGAGLTYQWKKGGVNVTDGGTISGAATATLNISSIIASDAGNYTVVVTGTCGSFVTSSTSALIVNTGVTITVQPTASQTLCTGNAAAFTVTATGAGLTYQWQKGGVNVTNGGTVSGAMTISLAISSIVSGDAGNYTVIVSATCGAPVTSSTSVLNVNTGVAITVQPTATQTLCAGLSASMTVTATGSGLTYQWKKGGVSLTNGGTISGATAATLNISSLVGGDAGNYTVDVTAFGCGSAVTSSTSVLAVNTAAAITVQPTASQTLCIGNAAAFSVAANGTGLTYQWQKGGVNVTNGGTVSGATTISLAISSLVSGDAGNYTMIVTGTCGAPVTSSTSVLTVNSGASISTQPIAVQTLCVGDLAVFSVTASGTGLTYQWQKNGVNVTNGGGTIGATTATLSISSVIASNAGNYTVDISASVCGTPVTSSISQLIVNTPINITSQPAATQTLCTGNAATFVVIATGSSLNFQWQKNGVNISDGGTISGAATSSLTISSLVSGDAGTYTLDITGVCGAPVTSSSSVLTVNTGPSITTQPTASQTLCTGNAANFNVAATGSGITYQWQLNGVDLSNGGTISGATINSLAISSLASADAGNYRVNVSASGCGAPLTSSTSVLIVNNSINITTQPAATQTLCTGNAASFNIVATGTGITYQWQLNGVDLTNGGTISGATTASLNVSSLVSGNAGTYTVNMTGACAPVTSSSSILTVNTGAAITSQPVATQTFCAGVAASFAVTATGTGLTYQWQLGGVNVTDGGTISGATTATLAISAVATSDAGNYTVNVSAAGCGVPLTSTVSALIVNTPVTITTQPATSQTLCTSNAASFTVAATGSSLTYQWQLNGMNVVDGGTISGATTTTLAISSLVSGDAGNYTVNITGICGAPVTSTVSALMVNVGASITSQPVATQTFCAGVAASFAVTATGTGLTYQWQLGGVNVTDGGTISGATTATLAISAVATSDAGNYTVNVSAAGCGVPLTSTVSALIVNTPVTITTQPAASQALCTGNAASFIVAATGSSLTYQWQLNGMNVVDGGTISGATTTTLAISSLVSGDAGNYTVNITGICGAPVTSTVSALVVNVGASITSQPAASQTVCTGSPASFSVSATGSSLTYQWKLGGVSLVNGGTISGATTTILNISSVAAGDAGNFTVDVSAAGCGVPLTSAVSTLVVNNSIVINTQPTASQNLCAGTAASFNVLASGTGITYQWQKGGVNIANGGTISGATTANLSISSVALADAGSYTLDITGTCGTLTSNVSTLSVTASVAITMQPTDVNACLGQTANFDLTATGPSLTYQWKKNGVNVVNGGSILGATFSSLVFSSLVASDAAMYTCVISSSCGAPATSNTVTMTVGVGATITKQPISAVICLGQSASFTLQAPAATSFQWQFKPAAGSYADLANGAGISGVTTSTLIISSSQFVNRGNYRCVVTGGSCSGGVFSSAASLSFQSPSIASQPLSQSVCTGQTVTFSLVALGNNLTYQWVKSGVNMTNGGRIAGALSATLKITNTDLTDVATYYCEVKGVCPPPTFSDNVDLSLSICTGIAEAIDGTLFTIYPNPSTGIYHLDMDMYAAGTLTYEVFNILGESISSDEIHGEGKVVSVIDLSAQVAGVYIIKLNYDDKHSWIRLVLEK